MNSIKNNLIDIISQFVMDSCTPNDSIAQLNKNLHIIMSHSVQAIKFISIIEEEFDIEFEDDAINLDTFLNLDSLIDLISECRSAK